MDRFVVISGCSGGGKSTLLEELRRQGHQVVEEPGRRVVTHELATGGRALPWVDPVAFAEAAITLATQDLEGAKSADGFVFFDRGLVDALAALQHVTGRSNAVPERSQSLYNRTVFMAPPWPEIYVTDHERRHGFDEAVAEHERLLRAYRNCGYKAIALPKAGVAERAKFVLRTLTENRDPGA